MIKHVKNCDTFYEEKFSKDSNKQILLIPMNSRTTGNSTGNNDYYFSRVGGWSWTVPYIAGLFALSCQVKPDITPEEFWTEAYNTGQLKEIERNGQKYEAMIVNPVKLMERLAELK